MKALVLAAGFGTRLRPWTEERNKTLIPVAGVESLFYVLCRAQEAGANEIFVNAHYKADQIEAALKKFSPLLPRLTLRLSLEEKILGSGGAILKILEEETFPKGLLVLNADTLASFTLGKDFFSETSFAVSCDPIFFDRYNTIAIDHNNHWLRDASSAPMTKAHFLGTQFFSVKAVDHLQKLLKSQKMQVKECHLFQGIYEPLKDVGLTPKAIEFLMPLASENDFWFDLTNKEFFYEADIALSTKYFDRWATILKLRHPSLKVDEALEFWNLQAKKNLK